MNSFSNVKDQLLGCDKVYKFTLRQLLISRANIITLIIMIFFSVIAPPLLSVISGSAMDSVTSIISPDAFAISQDDGITDVYIVNRTPYAFDASDYVDGAKLHVLGANDATPNAENTAAIYEIAPNAETGGYSVTLKLSESTSVNTESAVSFSYTVSALFDSARYTMTGITADKLTTVSSPYSVSSGSVASYMGSSGDIAMRFIVQYVYAIIVLLLCSISTAYIIRAVLEEKASKLVENLLTSVRPLSLIIGKILAVMTYIIIILASVIISALVSSKITSLVSSTPVSLSAIGLDISGMRIDLPTLLLTVIALILSYLTYSVLAGISGACCSNMEEMDAATGTVMMTVMLGYFVSFTTCAIDSAPVAYITSLCPIISTFCAPVRYILGHIGIGTFILSLIIQAAIIVFLFVFCSKVYSEIIIRRGNRIKLKELIPIFFSKKYPK